MERMNGTDKDLAAHVTILNHYGAVLYGAAIHDIFGEVRKCDYIDSIRNDIMGAKEDILTAPVYVTLNLCRVLGYLRDGLILSKKSGGEWGLHAVPARYHAWIEKALIGYESGQEISVDAEQAVQYADYMLGEIEKYRQAAEHGEFFEKMAAQLGLGTISAAPYRVTGGYLHKMFHLETSKGSYAVKLLNPSIMKRPDALENFSRAERLEKILCEHKIPVVAAMEIGGSKLHCLTG